jgi:hypothetical protein
MQSGSIITASIIFAFATSGCSSRPRYFTATLSPPATDIPAFEKNMTICRELVGKGYRSNFGAAAASVGGGTIAGVATAGASIAAVDGGLIFGTATTASNALAVAMPFVGIGVGFGISRAIRSGREKKLKQALNQCLSENGYTVNKWTPGKRPKTAKVESQPEQVILP